MRQLLIYLICACSSICGSAQTGTLQGRATDLSGKPIANAHVIVESTRYGSTTDSLGQYTFALPAGHYTIHLTAIGFKSASQSVQVNANQFVTLNFEVRELIELLEEVEIKGIRSITGMGYLDETHDGVIYSGKKTEVLLLDSLDANTALNNPRQVLGRVPGANYSETEGSGFPSNGIGFRGLNPTQSVETNTRQNGYNITADLFGYPESYYLPPLEAVERIEVTRGASSLQFGPQFGGVINYILKNGNTSKPIEITTQLTGGSFGMFNSFTSAGGQTGKFNYYAYLQYQGAQGWRPNSDYRKITAFGKIEYRANEKLKVGVEYSILRNHIHMPGGLSDSLFNTNSRASYRARNWITSPWNILTGTLEWQVSPTTSLSVKSTFNSSGRDLVWRNEDGGPQAADAIDPATNAYSNREVEREAFLSNTTEARFLSQYDLGSMKNTLATGIRFFYGKTKRQEGGQGTTGSDFDLTVTGPYEDDLDFTTTNLAPFIENTFRFGERLSLTPGMRFEYIKSTVKGYSENETGNGVIYSDRSKDRYLFLAGGGIQFETSASTNLYANWSQAYRPMDYSSLTPLGTIVTVDSNLKDSNGFNSDIGFRGSVRNFLNFDVSGFYLQCNNRVGIIERTDATGNPYPFRTNVANSVHKGLEAYIEFNPVKAFSDYTRWGISFFNALAIIDARYTSGEFNGKFVEYAPGSINRFGTNLTFGSFSTTILVSSTANSFSDAGNSKTPSADAVAGMIPSYSVVDWSGTFHLKHYNLKMGVNNLTDQRYFTLRTGEYPGPGVIPSIGRSWYVGFGVVF